MRAQQVEPREQVSGAPAAPQTDPVCGMTLNEGPSTLHSAHEGVSYGFCSPGCQVKFIAAPDAYLKPNVTTPELAKTGATYTCPMHPEIRLPGPGSCPICGMTLEPVEVTADAAPNHELADMSRRFWIGLVLALPVFVLEMGSHIPGLGVSDIVPPATSVWIQFVLATPVVVWAGWPFFQRGENRSVPVT